MTVLRQQAIAQLNMYDRGIAEYILQDLERRYYRDGKKVKQFHLAKHFYFELIVAGFSHINTLEWIKEFFGEQTAVELTYYTSNEHIWEALTE